MDEMDAYIMNDDIFDALEMNMDAHDYYHQGEEEETAATTTTCYTTQEIFELAKTSKQKLAYQMNQALFYTMKTIARPIKDTHVLYICSEQQWKEKVNHYLQSTNVFSYIGPMLSDTSNNEHVQNVLNKMKNEIIQTLDNLYLSQAITNEQYESMISFKQLTILEVNKLNFIIEFDQNAMFLEPTMTCSAQEPTKSIAYFINSLLQPSIEEMIHSPRTSLSTGYQVIQALENYAQQGYLQSTTHFVKIDLHQLCTTLSHSQLIQALQKFLDRRTLLFNGKHHHHHHLNSSTTIVRLVQLILKHQFCVYENNLYQQTIGGSSASSLMMGLIDIYLSDLFNDLYLILIKKKELFARSFNHIIFTWNDSIDQLHTLLHQLHLPQHLATIPIQMSMSIDTKIQYLDTKIAYHEGRLHTKVNHHANLEPEALPYLFGTTHTRSYATLLRAAYIRAFLYCSDVIEFEAERMYIECSFQNNGQSFNWIKQIFHDLFIEFNQSSPTTAAEEEEEDHAWIDETTYHRLRMRIREYQEKQTKNHQRRRRRQQQQQRKKKSFLLKN